MDSLLDMGIFAGENASGKAGGDSRKNLHVGDFRGGKKEVPDLADDTAGAAVHRGGRPAKLNLRHMIGKEHLHGQIGIIGKGEQFHVISRGDLDMITYLKFILQQRRIEYVLVSTWQFSADDIQVLCDYKDRGILKRFDFYCGDAIGDSRRTAFYFLLAHREKTERAAWIFNHSKILLAAGEGYYFTVEGSGNLNTTKRIEQVCITEDRELFLFYKDFFDGLKSEIKNPAENSGFEPYAIT